MFLMSSADVVTDIGTRGVPKLRTSCMDERAIAKGLPKLRVKAEHFQQQLNQ